MNEYNPWFWLSKDLFFFILTISPKRRTTTTTKMRFPNFSMSKNLTGMVMNNNLLFHFVIPKHFVFRLLFHFYIQHWNGNWHPSYYTKDEEEEKEFTKSCINLFTNKPKFVESYTHTHQFHDFLSEEKVGQRIEKKSRKSASKWNKQDWTEPNRME